METTEQTTRTIVAENDGVAPGREARHLALMDRLDYAGWNAQDWDVFAEVLAADVRSVGFGQAATGVEPLVEYLTPIRASHPEFTIESHPIRIAVGDWTVVTGQFTNGQTMATIARWADERIAEEYVFLLDEG